MTPYADAVDKARKQQRVLKFCGVTILLDLLTVSAGLWLRLAGERPRRVKTQHPLHQRSEVAKESNV
jgi:hypothetical protein